MCIRDRTRRAAYKYQDGSYPTTTGSRTSNRPNVKFSISSSGGALPITLISFYGEIIEDETQPKTNIEWVVASQIDNEYFVVEHSIDGYVWEEIKNVLGEGTTHNLTTYNVIHNNPEIGVNYYRLKQVDYDGNTESFTPVSVFLGRTLHREFIIKKMNLIGQEVNEYYEGPVLILWNNGEVTRTFNIR